MYGRDREAMPGCVTALGVAFLALAALAAGTMLIGAVTWLTRM